MVRFKDEMFTVIDATVDGLSGRRCARCDGIIFDHESRERYSEASLLAARRAMSRAREMLHASSNRCRSDRSNAARRRLHTRSPSRPDLKAEKKR